MGLFNLLKKSPKFQDDFFGELTFIEFKDPSKNYFEGRISFKPGSKITEALIPGDINGPDSGQKEFFIKLQDNFDDYVEKVIPLIENEFRNWKEEFSIADFNKEFFLDCVTSPRIGTKPLKWELSFTTVHDKNHWIIIEFSDESPIGIRVDG
jgi:hypothetical protein